MRWFLFLVLVSCCAVTSALAGPNAGGILVVHDAGLLASATVAGLSVCGQGVIPVGISSVDARIDNVPIDDGAIFKVYALFPEGSSPRLLGVVWGLAYDPGISLSGLGPCGDFEMAATGWPASGTGTTVTWNTAQTAGIAPVYWFGAYVTASPAALSLTVEATQGGYFGDDTVPAGMDPIAGYGRLGFDTDGYVPPLGGTSGACCRRLTAACEQATAADCGTDLYLGPGVACTPDPCASRTGACCNAQTTSCADLTLAQCQATGGAFLGLMTSCALQGGQGCAGYAACCQGSSCSMRLLADCPPPGIWQESRNCIPQPCAEGQGACCNGVSCAVSTEASCAFVWLAATSCTPLPCNPAPGLGACCVSPDCQITDQAGCTTPGAVWRYNQDCNPSPCDVPRNPCCDPDGMCRMTTEENCFSPSIWHGDWTVCGPIPCPQPPAGACCIANTGICRLATTYNCTYPDTWQGEGSVCSPNPCPQPVYAACCDPWTGACVLTVAASCTFPHVWHATWPACSPNMCPQPSPLRVCCAPDLRCTLVLPAECLPPSTVYAGSTSCEPDPCGPVGEGTCCFPDGSCLITSPAACAASGAIFGGGPNCNPSPCAQAVPVRQSSWGRIKHDYR